MTDRHHQAGPASHQAPETTALRLPTRLMANLYLVLGIAALLLAGRSATDTLTRYGIGIAVELALAAAALVFIKLEGLSIRTTARLRRPEPRTLVLALAAVPGLWITGVLLNLLSRAILGYATPATPAQFPHTALEAIALAVTTMVVAPLCEEVMFRGYVQRAYERRTASERQHPWIGVVVGGLIFALYHLRFQGLFSLLPVALALGLIAWRTGSIVPAIVLHAGFNAIATLILIAASFLPMRVVAVLTFGLVFVSTLMIPLSCAALWLLWKTSPPEIAPSSLETRRPTLNWSWMIPLSALLAIYAYVAGTELLIHRFPELVLHDSVELTAPDGWERPVRRRYLIQDRLGREIGEAICTQTASERRTASERQEPDAALTISCRADHGEIDLTTQIPGLDKGLPADTLERMPFGLSDLAPVLRVAPNTWTMTATWSQPSLSLEAFMQQEGGRPPSEVPTPSEVRGLPPVTMQYPASAFDGLSAPNTGLAIRTGDGAALVIQLPEYDTLIGYEWAWRLSALPFRLPFGASVNVVQADAQGAPHLYNGFLHVQGAEPVWTPSGNYISWKVNLTWNEACPVETAGPARICREGEQKRMQTAWYDAQAPHTLVRFDSGHGAVSYILTAIEELHP